MPKKTFKTTDMEEIIHDWIKNIHNVPYEEIGILVTDPSENIEKIEKLGDAFAYTKEPTKVNIKDSNKHCNNNDKNVINNNIKPNISIIETPVKDTVNVISNEDNNINNNISIEDNNNDNYEMVNHPSHYNNYDIEAIDMMARIWGPEATAQFCIMTAFKYRMRMGTKPDNPIQQDIEKEKWYLNKANQLKNKLKQTNN